MLSVRLFTIVHNCSQLFLECTEASFKKSKWKGVQQRKMSVDGLSLTKPSSTLKGSSGKYMNVSQKSCHIYGGCFVWFLGLSGLNKGTPPEKKCFLSMITTMMGVIIVIIILVLLMMLLLKMTKKYHITWYWCQNIRDSYMVEKRAKKFNARKKKKNLGGIP